MIGPNWLTAAEAAARVGVSGKTVRNWIGAGVMIGRRVVRLAATRIGGQYRIETGNLYAFLAAGDLEPHRPVASPARDRARRAAAQNAILDEMGGTQ